MLGYFRLAQRTFYASVWHRSHRKAISVEYLATANQRIMQFAKDKSHLHFWQNILGHDDISNEVFPRGYCDLLENAFLTGEYRIVDVDTR